MRENVSQFARSQVCLRSANGSDGCVEASSCRHGRVSSHYAAVGAGANAGAGAAVF